jgi:hypothetical protein
MARGQRETAGLGSISLADWSREGQPSIRPSVTAARRPLEASGLGSNPRGGADRV